MLPLVGREIPVIADEWVKSEFGTGAVKVTPAHDPNDFAIGQRHKLPAISVMDETAHMNAEAGAYAGLDRYEARKKVLEDLEAQGLLGRCGSTSTRLANATAARRWWSRGCRRSGSVKTQPLAEMAIAAVSDARKKAIRFTPEKYEKMYLEWMRNIHDWCISRQLWWGHRIPAWHCAACRQDHGGAGGSDTVRALRERGDHAGDRRSGYVVLVGTTAGDRVWVAGANAAI